MSFIHSYKVHRLATLSLTCPIVCGSTTSQVERVLVEDVFCLARLPGSRYSGCLPRLASGPWFAPREGPP